MSAIISRIALILAGALILSGLQDLGDANRWGYLALSLAAGNIVIGWKRAGS